MRRHLVRSFFSWYISRLIRSDFESFSFNEVPLNKDKSVLLIANHFSWWDGFFMYELNKRYLKKNFHVMVSEENYRKVWFLKYLGAFPVKKHSKKAIESLEYAGRLLNDGGNLVLIFPQGQLYSSHVRNVAFEKGLLNLINSSDRGFQYLFVSTFVDYFQKRKPSVRCYMTVWEGAGYISLQLIKNEYNKHYEYSRQLQSRLTF